jgi:hypothetical protein
VKNGSTGSVESLVSSEGFVRASGKGSESICSEDKKLVLKPFHRSIST